jgi:UDP-N-acetylmuramoylalanine--D-glutamate ligase
MSAERFSVVGAGRSGVAAANALARRGHDVVLFESRPDAQRPEALDRVVGFVAGSHAVRQGDTAVLSPGIPEVSPVRGEIAARANRVIGEIELFCELTPAPVLAITGTDGKSTTTTMLGAIVKASGARTVVGGNLGNPLTGELETIVPETIVVAEISCFQLTTCLAFRPRVACVTNIAEDHIDYHGSFEAYQAAKRRIWQSMTSDDTVVLNGDDPYIASWLSRGLGPSLPSVDLFSVRRTDCAAFVSSDELFVTPRGASAPIRLMLRSELPLVGIHNVQNALAAAQMAVRWGISPETCRQALATYEPLPHRLRRVAEVDGVVWINDSKATNPNAAMAGIRAIDGPLIALVGGSSKDADFREIAELLVQRARAVVCFGQTAEQLHAALSEVGHRNLHRATTMEAAMASARKLAHAGDTVVLSPACASFDAFRGYAHRGEVFEALVMSWR